MLALTELSELSTLAEEVESWLELVLIAPRLTSTLEDELDSERDDV